MNYNFFIYCKIFIVKISWSLRYISKIKKAILRLFVDIIYLWLVKPINFYQQAAAKFLNFINNLRLFQSSSSPRRVAVPVLVKDGKPCSGGSGNQNSTSATASDSSRAQQSPACPPQQQSQCMANGGLAMAYRQQGNYQQQCGTYLPLQARAW